MTRNFLLSLSALAILSIVNPLPSIAQPTKVSVAWDTVTGISKTTPTLQVVANPMLRSHSPIHDSSFKALKDMSAEYVRYVPWCPYPHLAVAELKRPTHDKTFWDFTLTDSLMAHFMAATAGHSVVINFSTIPAWLFKGEQPQIPEDPNQVFWDYNTGKVLRDSTMKELSDYFARLFSWYTKGGFTDELGKFHKSGHFYKIPYWEVLNEPDLEHNIPVKEYTRIYDAIVTELKEISPETKFVGISLAFSNHPEWFEYFLDKKNHKAGIPLDVISYHFYAVPASSQTLDQYQYSFFDQAIGFMNTVRYIESIRKRLSPQTRTMINELGSIINSDGSDIPADYWNLTGALYAWLYLEMTKTGIDVAGESQLVGYPSQFPDVSMMDWKNGKPNARYWVLKLLKDHFGPGDRLVETKIDGGANNVTAQGFVTKEGKYLLLINRRNKDARLTLPPDAKGKTITEVNQATGEGQAVESRLTDSSYALKAFAVAIVKL